MLELSPSVIDSYFYWRGLDNEDVAAVKLEELRAQIRRDKRPPSEPMALGLAWHKAIETEPHESLDVVRIDLGRGWGGAYAFDAESVRAARGLHPDGTLREVEATLEIPAAGVRLNLRADGLSGNEVHEVKSTTKDFNPDKYLDTIQWRAYLLAFEASVVVYHVCRLEFDDWLEAYRMKDHAIMRQFPYPSMRADVEEQAREVADFVRSEGLAPYREVA